MKTRPPMGYRVKGVDAVHVSYVWVQSFELAIPHIERFRASHDYVTVMRLPFA